MMKSLLKIIAILIAMTIVNAPSHARETKGFKSVKVTAAFEDVFVSLQDAIVNKGYNVDYVGHLNQMLKRTSKAVGSVTEKGSSSPYKYARFMQFCSAKLTHEAISANAQSIAICPYIVFIYEAKSTPGVVVVGYRRPVRVHQNAHVWPLKKSKQC